MPNDKEHFVGIDVAVLGEKNTVQLANPKGGIARLVKRMRTLKVWHP